MTNQHPITPPLALINQWWDEAKQNAKYGESIGPLVAIRAAQWGADQELEACLKHLFQRGFSDADILCLRAARRPKPPSLKEQALESLHHLEAGCEPNIDLLRRALRLIND
jgi:hypothetical protein